MNLAEFLSSDRKKFLKPTPPTGEQSDWLDFCELVLKGGSILIVDAQFVPSEEDGLLVKLTPGNYSIQAKAVNYGGDVRVARLRVFQSGAAPKLAGKLGETWTDTAKTGICDFEIFSQAWGADDDASYGIIEPFFDTDEEFGIAIFDATRGAVMPFVNSGFGDGCFPVFELQADGNRIGFEIEFVADKEACSPGQTPYERQSRVREIENRAAQGNVEAQCQLGKMYQTGKEVEKNLEKAAHWFDKAAQNGSAEASLRLGAMFKVGKGKPQDYLRAKEHFELAAARGSVSALNELGRMYRHGQGVVVDLEKAVAFYRQAADKGFANAQYNLAVHCANGWGIQQDYEEAAKWYRLAADQGNLNAMCNLGNLYKRGEGVPKDEKQAVKLFRLASSKGHGLSTYNLGNCFENGIGVEKSFKIAAAHYRMAAFDRVLIAQKAIGVFLKYGKDEVKMDLQEGLKWLRKASDGGIAEAHYELGLLYETGEGVATDKVEACRLYQKAANSGFAKAGEQFKKLTATLTDAERTAIAENNKSED